MPNPLARQNVQAYQEYFLSDSQIVPHTNSNNFINQNYSILHDYNKHKRKISQVSTLSYKSQTNNHNNIKNIQSLSRCFSSVKKNLFSQSILSNSVSKKKQNHEKIKEKDKNKDKLKKSKLFNEKINQNHKISNIKKTLSQKDKLKIKTERKDNVNINLNLNYLQQNNKMKQITVNNKTNALTLTSRYDDNNDNVLLQQNYVTPQNNNNSNANNISLKNSHKKDLLFQSPSNNYRNSIKINQNYDKLKGIQKLQYQNLNQRNQKTAKVIQAISSNLHNQTFDNVHFNQQRYQQRSYVVNLNNLNMSNSLEGSQLNHVDMVSSQVHQSHNNDQQGSNSQKESQNSNIKNIRELLRKTRREKSKKQYKIDRNNRISLDGLNRMKKQKAQKTQKIETRILQGLKLKNSNQKAETHSKSMNKQNLIMVRCAQIMGKYKQRVDELILQNKLVKKQNQKLKKLVLSTSKSNKLASK